jgi:hypothetical protein
LYRELSGTFLGRYQSGRLQEISKNSYRTAAESILFRGGLNQHGYLRATHIHPMLCNPASLSIIVRYIEVSGLGACKNMLVTPAARPVASTRKRCHDTHDRRRVRQNDRTPVSVPRLTSPKVLTTVCL